MDARLGMLCCDCPGAGGSPGCAWVAVEQGLVIAAGKSGKVKTASTMVCICLLLAIPNETLRLVCVAVILVTTVYSGVEYFIKNLDVLSGTK